MQYNKTCFLDSMVRPIGANFYRQVEFYTFILTTSIVAAFANYNYKKAK